MPPSPSLSMRMAKDTYLIVVTMIRVQMISDKVPRMTARSGWPPAEGENGFQRVERTRSDIAKNHTQGSKAQGAAV